MKKIFDNVIKKGNIEYYSNIEFCEMNSGVDETETRKQGADKPYLMERCTKIEEGKYRLEVFKL